MADTEKGYGLVMTGQLRSLKAHTDVNKETGETYDKLRAVIDVGEDFFRFVDAKAGSDAAKEMERDLRSKVGQVVSVRCWARYALNFSGATG